MRFVSSDQAVPVSPALAGRQTAAGSQVLVFQLLCDGAGGSPGSMQGLSVFRPESSSRCANISSINNNRWYLSYLTSNSLHTHTDNTAGVSDKNIATSSSSSNSSTASVTNGAAINSSTVSSPGNPQQQQQQQQPIASASHGFVPALFLGDVFITANTVSGIINSSAAAAAEGRLPTARHARANRTAHQQQQQHVDPAAALLLQLMQPLPQPFPSIGSSNSSEAQQQQRRLFFVQRDSAELVRQELLLHRYQEVVAARAAAGLPTTAAAAAAPSTSSSRVPEHRMSMVEGVQAAVTGPGHADQQQQQQQQRGGGGVGRMLQELHEKVAHIMPGWSQNHQQQQQQQQQGQQPSTRTSANPAATMAAAAAAKAPPGSADQQLHPSTTAGSSSSSTPSGSHPGSSSGMVGAKRSLPAVLAAQLSSFMADLHTLEEEAVLREGQHILQQRQQRSGSSGRAHISSSSIKDQGSTGSKDVGSGVFNFASYVARMPLAAAMQLLHRQHQRQATATSRAQDGSSNSGNGSSSGSSSSNISGYDLAVSVGDVRACLAVQQREAFIDLDDVSSSSNTWQLGVYEAASEEDDETDEANNESEPNNNKYITTHQRNIASAAAVVGPERGTGQAAAAAAGGQGSNGKQKAADEHRQDNSSSRRGRWRWGCQEGPSTSSSQEAAQQQQQQQQPPSQNDEEEEDEKQQQEEQQQRRPNSSKQLAGFGSAAYTPLHLPGARDSSSSSSGCQPLPLSELFQQQQQYDDYGEVKVSFSDADVGTCDRTPVFQVPGLEVVLDTSHGEVSFTPTFLSLSHLVTLLTTAKQAATKMWICNRRDSRQQWRQSVEMAAAALAAGGSSGGGRYGSSGYGSSRPASAAAAEDEMSEDDEDGMGDPPEAKALLEELGEGPSARAAAAAANRMANFGNSSSSSSASVPTRKGVVGVINSVALGTISLAAAGCCAVQEVMDQAAVAVPALGEWMIGFPNSVNIKGAFLEDLAAAAAEHNAGRLKPPKALLPASSSAAAAAAAAQPATAVTPASAAAATSTGHLYDPLGLVQPDATSQRPQQQQQQQIVLAPAAAPVVSLPCLDGLKLLLHAGWSVVCDVLLGDGKVAAAIMSGSSGAGRRMGLGTVQVSEEGEVALRLGLAVMAAPAAPLSYFTNSSGNNSGGASSNSSKKGARKAAEPHVFEVGIHLNLSQLIGVPSMQHENQLSAARGGLGSAGKGLLMIGDLALEPSEMSEALWRGPQLGFGVLPVSPLLLHEAGEVGGKCSGSSSSSS